MRRAFPEGRRPGARPYGRVPNLSKEKMREGDPNLPASLGLKSGGRSEVPPSSGKCLGPMGSREDEELLRAFLPESAERLADLEAALLDLEGRPAEAGAEAVNAAFRAVHTIKGGAGLLGLVELRDLAHRMEGVLDEIRKGAREPTSETVDGLLAGADEVRRLLARAGRGEAVGDESGAVPAADASAGAAASPADVGAADTAPSAAGLRPAAVRESADSPARPGTLRVRAEVLDALMSRVSELILARNQLRGAISARDARALEAAERGISRIATALQRAVLEARMQPLSAALGGIPRLARDAARSSGKEVGVLIEGAEVELDRTVLDRLAEPLAHIVRNSIAHGIEAPEARVASGKSPRGTIRLAAVQRGARVELTISDDGQGFDLDAMRRRAVERGVRTEAELGAMSEAELLDLAFIPNFSTAERVSELAGRGVGLDAVRAAVSGFGGTVELRSHRGLGAAVVLRLPLTLAILDALILRVGDLVCAAPESYVERVLRIEDRELSAVPRIRGAEYFEIAGETLPLVRLERVLESDGSERGGGWTGEPRAGGRSRGARSAAIVIIISTGAYRYALLADAAEEVQEIVLKPMPRGLPRVECFAGTSVLGGRTIALVLDLAAIARRARVAPIDAASAAPACAPPAGASREGGPLILAGGFDGSWCALPLGSVWHVESVRASRVERVGERFFVAFEGRPLEVFPAGGLANAASLRGDGRLFVVVLAAGGRRIGVFSPRVPDAVESWTACERAAELAPPARDVVLIGDRVATLLDPHALAELGLREAVRDTESGPPPVRPAVREGDEPRKAVLVVEDSAFLRAKICALLRGAGYETADAPDGRAALERLRNGARKIDLVVTDIEMPELDGFALAAAIREDPRLRHLPVIALSALTGDEHIARAYKAGVDEYLFKLEPEQILEAVARHLSLADAGREAALAAVPARDGGGRDAG